MIRVISSKIAYFSLCSSNLEINFSTCDILIDWCFIPQSICYCSFTSDFFLCPSSMLKKTEESFNKICDKLVKNNKEYCEKWHVSGKCKCALVNMRSFGDMFFTTTGISNVFSWEAFEMHSSTYININLLLYLVGCIWDGHAHWQINIFSYIVLHTDLSIGDHITKDD